MDITIAWLEEKHACSPGIKWWKAQKELNGIRVVEKLITENRLDWANWLITRLMTPVQRVQYAIFAAEQVIELYEQRYPDDNRPRKEIEAAKDYLKKHNKPDAADAANAADAASAYAAASYAAYAAADAASAAAAAASAAAYAAYAVASAAGGGYAAYAVAAAAYAAASAGAASASAASAGGMKKRIIEMGIEILRNPSRD